MLNWLDMATRSRNSQQTRRRILQTVEKLLVKEGFSALGINRIAEETGVAKVLIYRYFGDLEGLLRTYVNSADFLPTRDEIVTLPPAKFDRLGTRDRIKHVINNFSTAMAKRPHTLAILGWELSGNPSLTRVLSDAIARLDDQITELLSAGGFKPHPLLREMMAIINAGLMHLGITYHNSQRFGPVRIESKADWKRIMQALELLVDTIPLED